MVKGGEGQAALPGSRFDIIDFNFSGLLNASKHLLVVERVGRNFSERAARRFDLNIETNLG